MKEVVDENVSKYDNAKELFQWVHSNIRYQHAAGDRSSVWAGAYEGLHDGAGDCYAFYATYSVLLTYAGIDNLCVARVSDSSHHWWNLVNTGEGWYHCDASPRRNGDRYFCFMQTDAQVEAYTRAYPEKPDYYTFDASLLPERATEIIVGYDPDTIYETYNTEAVEQYLESLRKEEAEDDAITDEIDPDADLEIEEQKNADTEDEAGEADKEDTKNEAGAGNETDTEHESEAEDSEDEKSDTEKKSDKKKSDKKKKSDTSEVNGDSSTEKETETGETENGEKARTSKKNKKKTSKKAENTQEDTEAADSETEAASEETE